MPVSLLITGYYRHPKMLAANAVAGGEAAEVLWCRGLDYVNEHGTDGFIPYTMPTLLCPTKTAARVRGLVQAGLWDEVEGGYHIHDYLDFQPSAEKVRKERQKTAERQARAKEKRAEARGKQAETGTRSREQENAHAPAHAVSNGVTPPVSSAVSALAPNPNPLADSPDGESLPATVSPKAELVVMPALPPPAAAGDARALTCAFWERTNPKPAVKFIALLKLVERFLDAGWSEEAVGRALDETRAYTVDAITFSLRQRQEQQHPGARARPKSMDLLQRRMAQYQAQEARG